LDDRGFPDQSDEYDHLLHSIDGGPVLRKLRHPMPDLHGPIDPSFNHPFVPEEHDAIIRQKVDLSHLTTDQQNQVYDLIREFWPVFDARGVFVTVKNYECVIDTGTARPIAVKKILYGERETVIMRRCISALAKVGHIRQITDGRWLFKALLAAKPHQEHVRNIEDFVWRFCVNYIPLNGVTRIIAYPIPRCDSAVFNEFGRALWWWMFDAPMGYHQLAVAPESQEKLAFQGVDAIKWTYTVMPFGPTNGPATFINFIHDIDSVWKELSKSHGITIDDDTNTRIIVDDIVSWAPSFKHSLLYMRCQLIVCRAYRLSLNLAKSHFFPRRFEFVGIDVCTEGNRPAKSKHQLLQSWPAPTLVRDVAKFLGFVQFYSRFIPNFEIRVEALRTVTKQEYTEEVGPYWNPDAEAAWDDLKGAILSDPCIQRFDHRKLIVLRTDFSSKGFGYVLLQPGNDEVSVGAARDYLEGKGFPFMTKDSKAILHPVCFGARRTRGNEIRLHSHLGEGFSGDYAINKCRSYVFGQRFVWVTDCYAIKFILSYEGGNPAILRLQMRLMCWDVDIVHRPDSELVDADYWSRLNVDIEFDPLFKEYLEFTRLLRQMHPAPTDLPMRPENMPYYRGPRFQPTTTSTTESSNADTLHIQSLLTDITTSTGWGHTHLSNVPVRFGEATPTVLAIAPSRSLLNSELAQYARQALTYDWAVFSFSNGHFLSSIESRSLPFTISLACDTTEAGRSLFHEFAPAASVFKSGNDLLNHIRASGEQSVISGYLINSYRFQTSDITSAFWKLQLSIIAQLRLIRSLSIVVAIVISDHDRRAIRSFSKGLAAAHWKISSREVSYLDIGDSIADSCLLITAVHSSCTTNVDPIVLKSPPPLAPRPIRHFLWMPFDRPEHAIGHGKDDPKFNSDDSCKMTVSVPKSANPSLSPTMIAVKYYLHRDGQDTSILAGSSVISRDSTCPPFESCPNRNIFQHYFGIEFHHDDHTYVRAISTYEFARCFSLSDNIQYRMSHERYKFGLDAAMPGRTSSWLFEQVHSHLVYLRDSNSEVFSPNQFAAPAATIQTLVNGAICTRLPSKERWVQAYNNDTELCAVRDLALHPSKLSNKALANVNHNYRGPLRQSLIVIENDMLILHEPIIGTSSFTRLQLVPLELRNIVFIAFHTNPIGGHLNAYRTFHRLRLRFYWPGMYSYVKRMCQACPGCALANPTRGKSSELVYNFPIEAPFLVMFFDAYSAGKHASFEGSECYLIGCCGMCSFACMEPITHASATTFASAIMKILLRYGFCHTIVLDKDSKFFGVCREAIDLLKINCHVLSSANHNPMIVERINRYLTKGLKIMCNERDSVRVALEAILLLLYAWNSCPVPGTDISRSLVAVGREFAFPIDYSSGKHWELTSSPSSVVSYSKELATRLSACRQVADLLVREQRTYHRELINARRPDPRVYSVGDVVFARRAVKSDAARGKVDKLQYSFTGPWRVTGILPGASYELEHCDKPSKKEKKHASDLSPYPTELIPFQPVDGADTRYGQLYKPISAHPFKEAGIVGFNPVQPFKVATSIIAQTNQCAAFHWPSLSELNDDIAPFPWADDAEYERYLSGDSVSRHTVLTTGPPPAAPAHSIPSVPAIHLLTAAIIKSNDRLFFVSHNIGANDAREWRLARVAFDDSISLYPSCTLDGRFLFEFYICHPADWRYNAVNQRYWIQFHGREDILHPSLSTDTHLVRPSDTSDDYAIRHNLLPFRKWLNITHTDTFIHGPFEFATVRGRKTRDRICQNDWDILRQHKSMFQNPLPSFDVPTYSIHVDRGAHVAYHDKALTNVLCFEASQTSDIAQASLYP
jgi:hypothetical protein